MNTATVWEQLIRREVIHLVIKSLLLVYIASCYCRLRHAVAMVTIHASCQVPPLSAFAGTHCNWRGACISPIQETQKELAWAGTRISVESLAVLTEDFNGFPNSCQANTRIVHQVMPCPFSSDSFRNHYSLSYSSTLYSVSYWRLSVNPVKWILDNVDDWVMTTTKSVPKCGFQLGQTVETV